MAVTTRLYWNMSSTFALMAGAPSSHFPDLYLPFGRGDAGSTKKRAKMWTVFSETDKRLIAGSEEQLLVLPRAETDIEGSELRQYSQRLNTFSSTSPETHMLT